ncbi:hypothetical protein AYI70_g9603, partial [Smittium culicis]
MYTDASNIGIGASLHQLQNDNTIRPIAYASQNVISGALSRDFKDIDSGGNKIAVVQTRSQGPPKRTIRRFGQLDTLADSSSEIDSISDGV